MPPSSSAAASNIVPLNLPLPPSQQPKSHFYSHQQDTFSNVVDDDYAYRVTQIVDEQGQREQPRHKKHPVARPRPSKKKSRRSSRVSRSISISTDSGTEMASPVPNQRNRGRTRGGQTNQAFSHSRTQTPSSSHEVRLLEWT